jgi:thiol:disulfide interchange protein DsbD
LWLSLSALLVAATLAWAWPSFQAAPMNSTMTAGSVGNPGPVRASESGDSLEGHWQPWSPERVQAALASGRPVFVDFTAAWCVTCQFNKRTTLADAQVKADFAAKRVVPRRAC